MATRRRTSSGTRGRIPLAELGAIVVCLEDLEARYPGRGALGRRDAILDARLRSLTAAQVREHFHGVPARESEPLWCRAPREDTGPYQWTMGSSPSQKPDRYDDEGPVTVTLTQPFWIAATPVTLAQYELMAGAHAQHREDHGAEGRLPVTFLSWFEARLYCAWLDRQRRRDDLRAAWASVLPQEARDSYGFTLPTEAQWEFACRAWWPNTGTPPRFWSGESEEDLRRVAWYHGNSEGRLHPVAERNQTANDWGLYDMHGNAWEWCLEWYERELRGGADPGGPRGGVRRVRRGGSFWNDAWVCRSACRGGGVSDYAWVDDGFRVVLSAP